MPYQFDMSASSNKSDPILLRDVFARGYRAVLAPASGGCSRYIFSAEVDVRLNAANSLEMKTPDRSASQLALLRQTTQSLHIPLEMDADGITCRYLVLTGRLLADDQADPDSWHPFEVGNAHIRDISGTVQSVTLSDIGLA